MVNRKFAVRKEYMIIGMFFLFILLTFMGWYLKTNKVEVFVAGVENIKADQEKSNSVESTDYFIDIRKDTELININTADIDELTKLNGIGSVKAEAIIAYRLNNGYFNSIDEIKNVRGIGEATFLKIKDYISADIRSN